MDEEGFPSMVRNCRNDPVRNMDVFSEKCGYFNTCQARPFISLIPCNLSKYLMVPNYCDTIRLTYLDLSLSIFMKSCCLPDSTYGVFFIPP